MNELGDNSVAPSVKEDVVVTEVTKEPEMVVKEPELMVKEPEVVVVKEPEIVVVKEPDVVVKEPEVVVVKEPEVVVVKEPEVVAKEPEILAVEKEEVEEDIVGKEETVVVVKQEDLIVEVLNAALLYTVGETKIPPIVIKMLKLLPTIDQTHLQNMDFFFHKILEDKKLNSQDVPMLFALMQELFIVFSDDIRVKATCHDVGYIINILIKTLLTTKLQNVHSLTFDQTSTILDTVDVLIKISTDLIELKGKTNKIKSCCKIFACMC